MGSADFISLINLINNRITRDINIMEVCGTHTQAAAKAGFANILDPRIRLISGPGCPVCVTAEGYIDAAIELLQQPNIIIATFGDMLRVKGSSKSLEDCMMLKNRIKIVYSPFAALDMAEQNHNYQIVFLAAGFETTAPLIGAVIRLARLRGVRNLFFLVGLKLMPPVLKKVLSASQGSLDALICPGHVSAIMGSEYFSFVPMDYGIPAAVCGFEYNDMAAAIYYLCNMADSKEASLANLYLSCVRPNGNAAAKALLQEIFCTREGLWRGIGEIDDSELTLRKAYEAFDASKVLGVEINNKVIASSCQCGEIIIGRRDPFQCSQFAISCTPEDPKGPCMVSSEGACAIYYKFKRSGI